MVDGCDQSCCQMWTAQRMTWWCLPVCDARSQTRLRTMDESPEVETLRKNASDVTQTSKWLVLPLTPRAGGAMPSWTVGPLFSLEEKSPPPFDLDRSFEHVKCFRRGSRALLQPIGGERCPRKNDVFPSIRIFQPAD